MNNPLRAKLLPFAIASLLTMSPAMAQNMTSSALSGRVLDGSGQPVAGATVQIVHVPSGTTKLVTTNADGRYTAQGLRVGGPFDVVASKAGLTQGEQDNVYLQLGQESAINLTMGAEQAKEVKDLSGVTVSANALAQTFSPDNKGLSTNISQRQLQAAPTPGRSIADIARLDPRVTITDRGDGSISMAGMNSRYNSISVDGVGQGDPFGLNSNGMPYIGSPISMDTIEEYNIGTANYDVASDTVGASIDAVTKSGTNEYHGSVYYAYRNADKLVGNAGWLDEDRGYTGYKNDWTAGATFGGPIIKDKLFFFANYEEEKTIGIGADSANGLDPSLGSGPSTSNKVSPGDLQRVIDAAKALGLTPGSVSGGGADLTDKRYLVKLDWNINNDHRVSLTHQRTKEVQPIVQGNSSTAVGLSSYWYTKNSDTKNTVVQFYDDWSSIFSTEAKIGYQHFQQVRSVANQQPQISVNLGADSGGVPSGKAPYVNLGEDQYSHYNVLDIKTWRGFLAGSLYLGDHTLKAGVDFQQNQIYNLFGRTQFGAYTFWGVDNFEQGIYNQFQIYQPAPGYTIDDVAAQWKVQQYGYFLQDTWQVTNNLSLQYGVRINKVYTNDTPVYNPTYEAVYGIRNDSTVDGMSVVEPRLSFNYNFDTERMMQIRGGAGLFQSNPPTVWMTNPYQNNGMTTVVYDCQPFQKDTACTNPPVFSPDAHNQSLPPASQSKMTVDSIDPNFKLPSVWKISLAFDRELPFWGTVFSAEYQYIKVRNAIWYQNPDIGTPTGTLPDGRNTYYQDIYSGPNLIDRANGSTLIDPATGKSIGNKVRANGDPRFSGSSTYLTNTNKGKSESLTLSLKKPFSESWFGTLGVTVGNATEVSPGTSSQASSNFYKRAWVNPNDAEVGDSNYNIKRRLNASITWQHRFFGDYVSSVSAFYDGHSGQPYSWTFGNDANGDSFSSSDLVFIPKQGQVSFKGATDAQIKQFYDFIQSDKYLKKHQGEIAQRNKAASAWVNQVDLSFRQEIPGIFKGNKGEVRLDIYNFMNLLNSDWGQQSYVPFYYTRTLANYEGVDADGKYIYSLPTDKAGNYQPAQKIIYDAGRDTKTSVVSRWSAMLTLRYSF